MISSKSNFFKDTSTKDGLNLICIFCRRGYYNKNCEKNFDHRKNCNKQYNKQNRAKIIIYEVNRRKINLNFILAHTIRCRTSKAFKSQIFKKF